MAKYHLDWKMRVLFWLMGRGLIPSDANLHRFRAGSNANPREFLFRMHPIAYIEDRSIPGRRGTIPVRVYRPETSGVLPVVVFFHGGGFVMGGLDGHDAICRRIAADNHAVVVSVDYRLAPEDKYPAAAEDAYDAVCWVSQHAGDLGADGGKLIVMGDSAGGNLATVACLMSRDLSGPRIAHQVLIYPVVDMARDYPSKQRYVDNPVLSREAMAFYTRSYVRRPEDVNDPYVSPLLADDLANLPPALIITAEYDPLLDEGMAYAQRLEQAGNEAACVCYPGMPHGFLSFGRMASQADAAFSRIQQALQPFSIASNLEEL